MNAPDAGRPPAWRRRFGQHRGGAGTRIDRFPAEADWQWQLQLELERVSFPVRVLRSLTITVAWLVLPVPPGSQPHAAWSILAATWAVVGVDAALLFRWPELAGRFPLGGALVHYALATAWVAATGRGASPYLPLLFIGASSAAGLLPPRGGLVATFVYAATYLALAGARAWLAAAFVLVLGLGQYARSARGRLGRQAALRDALTGAFSRGYVLFCLERLVVRRAFPFSVAVLDLDGFKAVNDTYGHDAGDAVLVEFAETIARLIRPGDVLGRFGGDEFLVIWPGTAGGDAARAAERIRGVLAQRGFHLREIPAVVHLTVSVGVAEAWPGCTPSQLLRAADVSLYRAKVGGNRVELASEGTS
jgi:diguanylate cyclase (GGDEF)-like protein